MDALEAEEEIAVDDLPNFRLGAQSFDVDLADATKDDSATTWDDSVAQYEMPDVIRSFVVFFQKQMREGQVLFPPSPVRARPRPAVKPFPSPSAASSLRRCMHRSPRCTRSTR